MIKVIGNLTWLQKPTNGTNKTGSKFKANSKIQMKQPGHTHSSVHKRYNCEWYLLGATLYQTLCIIFYLDVNNHVLFLNLYIVVNYSSVL